MAVLNFWIDVALFFALSAVMWLTVMLKVAFPPGTRSQGWLLWGFTFDQWQNAQFVALCLCALLAVEHLVLHWRWVCSIVTTKIVRARARPDEAGQLVLGIGVFITMMVLMLVSLIAAVLMAQGPTA